MSGPRTITVRTARATVLGLLLLGGTGAGSRAEAENYDHPGLVFAGKDGWISPAEALEKGYVRYLRRWVPQALAPKLRAWEAEDRKHETWKESWKTESAHYRIETTVPRFVVETEIVPFLDALYDTYVLVFKRDFGLTGKGANKKTIKIHAGFEEYAREEAEDGEPRPRSNPGFFGGDALVVFYDDTDPGEFYSTVFHEGAHQFVFGLLPGAALPIWLDEGMAVYFEGCVYSRTSRKITVDHFPPSRVEEAQEVLKAVGADDPGLANRLFMDVPKKDFDSKEYALAWSFLHYLIHGEGGKRKEAFSRFLRATNGTGAKPIAQVFEESTKLRLKEVQAGWKGHVLAWTRPSEPHWVKLVTDGDEGADPGIGEGDLLFSIDGVEVTDAESFRTCWEKRPGDRPLEIVVLRRTPVEGFVEYRDAYVTVNVPAGPVRPILAVEGSVRTCNLRD